MAEKTVLLLFTATHYPLGEFMRVRVYRNLNNGKLSILHKKLGRVIGYAESVKLIEVKYVVLPGGKQRSIRTGQRNVHAFVEGVCVGAKNFVFKAGFTERVLIPDWYVSHESLSIPLKYSPFSELGFTDAIGQEHVLAHSAIIHSTGEIYSVPSVTDWGGE